MWSQLFVFCGNFLVAQEIAIWENYSCKFSLSFFCWPTIPT